ncbi:MAG: alanine racemase [Promethearchaeota archaeon]
MDFEAVGRRLAVEYHLPAVVCDLEAFQRNLGRLKVNFERAGKSMRLCTKSVRVPGLISRVLREEFVNGLLAFNCREVPYLVEQLGCGDVVVAYPTASPLEASLLAKAASSTLPAGAGSGGLKVPKVTAMVDSPVHLDLLERAAASQEVTLHVMVDLDAAYHLLGAKLGVERSPLRDPQDVVALARSAEDDHPHLRFRGIMAYEAQNASVADSNWLVKLVKRGSMAQVVELRAAVVEALREAGLEPEVVNGGGSGCHVATLADPSTTEVGVGSALYKPHLFDGLDELREFEPATFLALQVVRVPRRGVATAFAGGYACSGTYAPPVVVHPPGARVTKREGFGEVQTPILHDPRKSPLKVGDVVFCRFAKAGEPMERFDEMVLVREDGSNLKPAKTYRGVGLRGS